MNRRIEVEITGDTEALAKAFGPPKRLGSAYMVGKAGPELYRPSKRRWWKRIKPKYRGSAST